MEIELRDSDLSIDEKYIKWPEHNEPEHDCVVKGPQ
jgi:hypothetical protein